MPSDGASILNCSFKWKFQCPMDWARLVRAGRDDVRFCWRCQQLVYYCETPQAITDAIEAGRCVAVPSEPDEGKGSGILLGVPARPW